MMQSYSRRHFLKKLGWGTGALLCTPWLFSSSEEKERPNIILIMADDMGYSDLGCYGGEINTPNLDSLAKNGLRFSQFYNNAKCAPTRASLLTGLYSQQVGVYSGPTKMRDCATIAEVLKEAGYRTLMTGKWHADEIPVDRGFDRYYGLADGCCNFFNPGEQRPGEEPPGHKPEPFYPRRWAIDDQVYEPFTPEDRDFYTTDAFTDYALQYLDEYSNETQPFFLYIGYTAPHYPLHAWPEDIAKYRGKYMEGWDAIRAKRFKRMMEMGLIREEWDLPPRDSRVPDWSEVSDMDEWEFQELSDGALGTMSWEEVQDKDIWDLKMAVYAAMIDRMDWNIGRIVDKVKELGEEENTLVMFLSDNGGSGERIYVTPDKLPGPLESYRSVDPPWANASNTPFRKYKSWDHEGGIATPLIARWPGVIQPDTITHQMGHIIDIMATCVDLGDANYPETYQGRKVIPLEGKSLVPIFRGHQREGHDALYWQYGNTRAVREGKWKLLAIGRGPWELYDMEADRTELHDLADREPALVERLSGQWFSWAKRTHAKLPSDT